MAERSLSMCMALASVLSTKNKKEDGEAAVLGSVTLNSLCSTLVPRAICSFLVPRPGSCLSSRPFACWPSSEPSSEGGALQAESQVSQPWPVSLPLYGANPSPDPCAPPGQGLFFLFWLCPGVHQEHLTVSGSQAK